MAIETIRPASQADWHRLRGQDVTASVVGALFGEHDFITLLDLWAAKTGRVRGEAGETPAMQRGRLLEPVAVQLLRERHPDWQITHNAAANIYYRDPDARLGGTPDVIAKRGPRGRASVGVIQIKSVEASVYRRKWLDEDGEVAPPLWIKLQAILEAYLVGGEWALVAPLVIGHGLDMPEVPVELPDGVVDAMKARAADFWQMIAEGREPTPDYSRDGALIGRLYGNGDAQHEVDLSADNRVPELIEARRRWMDEKRVASEQIAAIDAEVMAKVGAAHVAHIGRGQLITWRPEQRAGFYVGPKTIRALRYPKQKD